MERRSALMLIGGLAASRGASAQAARGSEREDHDDWVGQVLVEMQSVRPGMKRADLMRVFRTEGGLSWREQRTYVSRSCAFFKVDVTFRAVEGAERDSEGRFKLAEEPGDVIVAISRPYLQFTIAD